MDAVKSKEEQRRQKAAALRYKRPALDTLGYDFIICELEDMSCYCDNIRWAEENCTEPVLDGDEDDGAGYRLTFSKLESSIDAIHEQIWSIDSELFDDCTVGLIGNRYRVVGYDSYEEDYFSLFSWDTERAVSESGKRLMRHTKAEMLTAIGQCIGILIAFYDVRQRFDYLKAALDVALGNNLDDLRLVRDIETAWQAWQDAGAYQYCKEAYALERIADELPEIYWVC